MTDDSEGSLLSLRLLTERCAAASAALACELGRPFAPPPLSDPAGRRYLVTGIGVSEGPARCLVSLLARGGRCAAFLPLSAFAAGPPGGAWDTLVLFSQGLSPNAQIALSHRGAYRDTILVTGLAAPPEGEALIADLERERAHVRRHPPASEGGILLRVIGPALSTLFALRLGAALAGLTLPWEEASEGFSGLLAPSELPAEARDLDLEGPLALVSCGDHGPLCHGLRWKLLEGLWIREPPQLDVLQVAHGPLQQFFDGPMTLLALERPHRDESALFDRLAAVLDPARHMLVRLRARSTGPLAILEHDAMCNRLLLLALAKRPRDLRRWPGQGRDMPLYGYRGS